MKKRVDHSAMAVVGYADPWMSTAGSDITFHLSSDRSVTSVSISRLDMPDAVDLDWNITELQKVGHQSIQQGSFLRIDELGKHGPIAAVRFELYLTRNSGTRVIFQSSDLSLTLQEGMLVVKSRATELARSRILPTKTWLEFKVSHGAQGVTVTVLSTDALAPLLITLTAANGAAPSFGESMCFGSDGENTLETLNAKFSSISIETATGRIDWTFPTVLPEGPIAANAPNDFVFLEPVNQPTFCVTSSRWDGSSFDPKVVPTHYDAIHCHDDDMGDLKWPASYRLHIPEGSDAGIYAFDVQAGEVKERIVFFISADKTSAPLLFVVPTMTYLAYADEYLPEHLYPPKCFDRGHAFAVDNNLRSLYDYHSDASGVSICSYRKPKVTLRDDYNYPLCGCPHNLPVDLHFLKFMHRNGVAFDLITDHDLHRRGLDALVGYQGVLTGSHPEYLTDRMESAYRAFIAQGGNLACFGGNGFAASVAIKGDLLELRRSPLESGRTWDGPVSELAFSITNEMGGLLRHRGRGEFSLVGGAISLMGFDKAHPFSRTKASYEPEAEWLFEGLESDVFGSEGMVLGGAAGYEVDATDPHLGTSPDTIIVAKSTDFSDSYVHDSTRWYEGGEDEQKARSRAEMTLRPLSNGAHIFSAGSVAWLGALPLNDQMNDVGRLTLNVLNRFSISQNRGDSQTA